MRGDICSAPLSGLVSKCVPPKGFQAMFSSAADNIIMACAHLLPCLVIHDSVGICSNTDYIMAGFSTGGAGGVPPRPAVAGGGSGGGPHGRHRTQRGCCGRTAGEGTPEKLCGCMRQQPNQHNPLGCATRLPITAAPSFTVVASLAWLLLHAVPVRSKACFADDLQVKAAANTIPRCIVKSFIKKQII